MAALRGLGAEQAEHDPQTLRYFARGHLYTDYVCRQLEAKHGKDAIEREVEIPWPHGVGHADAYVKPEKLLVEIKSTVAPFTSTPLFEMAVAQLRFYLRFHPEAEQGALYLINPSDLSGEDVYAVSLTDEDREEIDAAVASLRVALDGGPLPLRVCSKPGQARGRLCSFAEACFTDWVPPEPTEIPDPAALEAAARLAAIKVAERPLKEQLAALEEGRKEAQADLAELVDVGESVVGPWLVKRTHVTRQPTFSVKAFEAAGHSIEPLAEFFKPGSEYDIFKVQRAETSGELDFGDEAPY
jgi:CRISPR/Cas system-associated exonuclease Cas4 (RecB family)